MKIKLRETIVCVININKVTDFSTLNYSINKLTFRICFLTITKKQKEYRRFK